MIEYLYAMYVMCCTAFFYVIYAMLVYRVRTWGFTEYGCTDPQSYSLEWLICVIWYFGELTKLYAYSVGVICFRY